MDKVRKKLLIVLFAVILMVSLLPVQSFAAYNDEVDLQSNIYYMENLDQETVILSKNADKRTAMASLTKITTAMVVLDHVKNLDKVVNVTQEMMDTIANTNSSTAGIVAGEELSVRQLLNLMLVKSANEAASILAIHVAGDMASFVDMMNDYARKLGCKDTHYTNPHGLDEKDHYSTANDLAVIIKKALKNSTFRKIVAQPMYRLARTNKRPPTDFENTNLLLNSQSNYYLSACRGIKTGTTNAAGHCLASYASRNGYTYLLITIEGGGQYAERVENDTVDQYLAFSDSYKAYDWVFDNIRLKVVAQPSDIVHVVDILLGRGTDHVQLVPSQEVTALIPANVDASSISIEADPDSIPIDLTAPVRKGQKIATAKVMYAGESLCTIDLVAADDVHRSIIGTIGHGIAWLFSHLIVKIIFAVLVLLLLLLLFLRRAARERRRRSQVHVVRVRNQPTGSGSRNLRAVPPNDNTGRQPARKSSSGKKKSNRGKR